MHRLESSKEIVKYPDGARSFPPAPDTLILSSQLDQSNGGGGLIDYARMISSRPVPVILFALAGLLAGFATGYWQPKTYQASASIEVQEMNDKLLNKGELDSTGEASGESYMLTQLRILQSRTLVERVISKMKLTERTDLPAGSSRPSVQDYVEEFTRSMKVRSPDQTRMIEIFCEYPSGAIAAEFLNSLTEAYIDQNLEARWNATQRTERWLVSEINNLKAKLERSEADLRAYAQRAGLLFVREKDDLAEEKLRMMQVELGRAEAEAITKQSQFERAGSSPLSALPEVLDNGPLKEYQVKLAELKRNKAELESTLTPENSKVVKVQAQIAELESGMARERTNIVSRIKNEYSAAKRRQELLTSNYADQVNVVTQKAGETAHYNTLKFEVDTNRVLYESMLHKVKEYGIASALHASHVRVVDSAIVPRRPFRPNIKLNAGFGLCGGLLFGVIFTLIRERMNETFQAPGEAAAYLRVNELGAIPEVSVRSGGRHIANWHSAGSPANPRPALKGKRRSVSADSFRSTLTSINFMLQNRIGPQVLVVSSPGPGEGKTSTVSNLGIALAESGRRVLLIDADLRRPRLAETFAIATTAGLADLLTGTHSLEQAQPKELGIDTSYAGLFVLPAGKPTDPSVLYSSRLPLILDACKRHFDIILIDTPPLLEFADARVMAGLTDALILIVRARYTTRQQAHLVRERLHHDGIPLLGVVLNAWDATRNPYGDKYSRGYSSQYTS